MADASTDKYLMPDESVILRSNPHWIIYNRSLWLIGAAIITWANGDIWLARSGHAVEILSHAKNFLICIFLGWSAFAALDAWVTRYFTKYFLTSKRLVKVTGVIRRNLKEVMLNRVESVIVDQSLMARMLNYGDVVVTGTGGSREVIRTVSRPYKVRTEMNKVLEQIHKSTN